MIEKRAHRRWEGGGKKFKIIYQRTPPPISRIKKFPFLVKS